MPTLKDIAALCGTTTATVSYVLSGRGDEKRISPATQQKIRQAADELEYTPKMRTRDTLKYRVVVYFPLNDLNMLMPTFMEGLNSALNSEQALVDIILRPYEQDKLHLQYDLWTPTPNSAAIIISPGGIDLADITDTPVAIPLVLINRTHPNYASVSFDQLESGRLAAKHAIKKGGSDILLVSFSSLFGTTLRANAFVDTCRVSGINMENRVLYADTSINGGYELGLKLLREKRLAKVITCTYDMTALGLSSALSAAGVRIGRDVQIIATSSGNGEIFAHAVPPMTVVDLRFKDACHTAVRLAMGVALGRTTYPQDVSIRPTIIYRESCPM